MVIVQITYHTEPKEDFHYMNKYTMQMAELQEVKVPNPADPLAPQTRIYLDAAGNSVAPL